MTPSEMTSTTHTSCQATGPLSRGLTSFIRGYQLYISPLFGPHCRYYPSCSEYARQALIIHGPLKGARLAIARLLRCNPFNYGGVDPVPESQCCAAVECTAAESIAVENTKVENPLVESPLVENPVVENPLVESPSVESAVNSSLNNEHK